MDAGDSLCSEITSLESAGSLQLSGADVTLGQVISAVDIAAGNLTFTPAADENGVGYDSFEFRVHDGTAYSAAAYTMTVDVTPVQDLPTGRTTRSRRPRTRPTPSTRRTSGSLTWTPATVWRRSDHQSGDAGSLQLSGWT